MSLFSRYTFSNLRHPACGMATLKEIAVRLRSVKNIQKITASMKMVATSKFSRAERDLRAARPYGNSAKAFYEAAELTAVEDELKPNTVIVAIASDRGLCGAANSTIVKAVRALLKSAPEAATSAKLVLVGDKARSQLSRTYRDLFWLSFSDVGKKTPTFGDAATVAEEMAHSGVKFDQVIMFYNTFKSVISYNLTTQPIHDADGIRKSPKYPLYDSVDGEVLRSFSEYLFVALIYAAMKEAAASEQSARMTAMDAATKNAGDMIDRLTLTFNRTRQAVITRELTEIISGAAAV